MSEKLEANLQTIAQGGASEIFARELQRVIENVRDVNTDPKKKRTITLTFECTPYPDRSGFAVAVSVSSKLQSPNGVNGTVYIGREGARYRGFTQDIRQGDLFGEKSDEDEDRQAAPQPATTPRAN